MRIPQVNGWKAELSSIQNTRKQKIHFGCYRFPLSVLSRVDAAIKAGRTAQFTYDNCRIVVTKYGVYAGRSGREYIWEITKQRSDYYLEDYSASGRITFRKFYKIVEWAEEKTGRKFI